MSEAPTSNNASVTAGAYGAGNVPAGYKRTEVGVIPKDWDVASLGSCLRATPDYGINAPAVPFDEGMPTYLRITDIGEDNRYTPSPRVSVNHPSSESYLLVKGDLVFARTGASTGKSYLYNPTDGELAFAGFLVRVKPEPARLDSTYCSYAVQSERYWKWVATMSTRSGQPGINAQEYETFRFPLPRVYEQRAITEALSDVDSLLESLDVLIAKKLAIKHAAMQQLLTGKSRLPGFSGKWNKIQLGDLGHWRGGITPLKADPRYWFGGTIPWLTSSDVRQGQLNSSSGKITEEALKETSVPVICSNSVVVVIRSGILRRFLPVASNSIPVAINQDLRALEPGPLHRPQFLVHALMGFERFLLRDCLKAGTTVESIDSKWFHRFELSMPALDEQEAIATVLSDVDAEIAALEAHRDKARTIKQGMMQQLLTGRVRLI